MKRVQMDTQYRVADGDVRLSITIGEAQLGMSLVRLQEREVVRGEVQNHLIGHGPELIGKRLSIKTVVTDVNDSTNRTSVSYRLIGGASDQEYNLSATVDEQGDSVVYRVTVDFTA